MSWGNAPVYNFISTAVCGSFWVINAIPYFMAVPAKRQGPPLPKDMNHFTVGWKSIYIAIKEARKLRYLFLYIFAYFMFADAVSTTNSMIGITQSQITHFNAQQITLLNLASAITSIIGCLFFLWIAKRFGVRTKTNLMIIVTLTAVVPLWGCFGIGLSNFGIKTTWELWVFYVWSGLFTAPIWAWQTPCWPNLFPEERKTCSLVCLVLSTRLLLGSVLLLLVPLLNILIISGRAGLSYLLFSLSLLPLFGSLTLKRPRLILPTTWLNKMSLKVLPMVMNLSWLTKRHNFKLSPTLSSHLFLHFLIIYSLIHTCYKKYFFSFI